MSKKTGSDMLVLDVVQDVNRFKDHRIKNVYKWIPICKKIASIPNSDSENKLKAQEWFIANAITVPFSREDANKLFQVGCDMKLLGIMWLGIKLYSNEVNRVGRKNVPGYSLLIEGMAQQILKQKDKKLPGLGILTYLSPENMYYAEKVLDRKLEHATPRSLKGLLLRS